MRRAIRCYLRWLEEERAMGRSAACLAKYVSHVRGLLDYAWRSGPAQRNVLDGFALKDDSARKPRRRLRRSGRMPIRRQPDRWTR